MSRLVKRSKLEEVYEKLLDETYSRCPGIDPSFTTGLWAEEESYKYQVHKDARAAMQLDTWEENINNPRYIFDRAVDAIDACGNLLATDNSHYAQEAYISTYNKVLVTMLENLETTASALYGIFSTEDTENDGVYFDMLAGVLRKIYDGFSYVAYFFFLKDMDKYVPVRRKANTLRLRQIGVSAACMERCNWKNYNTYLEVVREIQEYLIEKGHAATLLDAQSFLWMLHFIAPRYN